MVTTTHAHNILFVFIVYRILVIQSNQAINHQQPSVYPIRGNPVSFNSWAYMAKEERRLAKTNTIAFISKRFMCLESYKLIGLG
jgi:hemolysin-activating ACP:hemolysin acyltransferase